MIDDPRPLERLAAHYGIEPDFTDNWQRRHQVGDATKQALLTALGVPAGSAAEIEASLSAALTSSWQQVLAPVEVVRNGAPVAPTVTLPANAGGRLAWVILTEAGERHGGEVRLDALELTAEEPVDGVRYQRRRLPLPVDLPLGYHRLEVAAGGGEPAAMALIVVPEHAFGPADVGRERLFGVTLPLYGLRSEPNWGIGDFGDLAGFATAMAGLGVGLIGINPAHALFPSLPERISPYAPSSRRFLNVLLISIERAALRIGSVARARCQSGGHARACAGRGSRRLWKRLGAEAGRRSRRCIAPSRRTGGSAGPSSTSGREAERASSARRSSRPCSSISPARIRDGTVGGAGPPNTAGRTAGRSRRSPSGTRGGSNSFSSCSGWPTASWPRRRPRRAPPACRSGSISISR